MGTSLLEIFSHLLSRVAGFLLLDQGHCPCERSKGFSPRIAMKNSHCRSEAEVLSCGGGCYL